MRARKVVRLLRLGPRAWLRLAHTLAVSRRIEQSLARETLDRTARRFGCELAFATPPGRPGRPPLSTRELRNLELAARVLARPGVDGTCLRRALVYGDVLRDRRPLLRMGVAKSGGEVTAHAWLELDGWSLDPMALERFSALHAVDRRGSR